MRDHELELIAALVEGQLEDEAEARALIASSPEHAEEYEAQKLAYETLKDAGVVSLSDTERASLHRDVWTALRTQPAAKARSPWWYRWTPVAAGLLVVAGSVAVLNQNLGGEDSMETFAEVGSALDSGGGADSDTTTAGATEDETRDGESSAADGGDSVTETTEAMTETTEAMTEEQPDSVPPEEPAVLYSSKAADVRQGNYEDAGALPYDGSESGDSELQACVAEAIADAGLDGYELLAILEGLQAGDAAQEPSTTLSEANAELAVVTPETADLSAAPLAFVDLEDCVVVYLDE
jgi:hypothetical protein